MTRTDPWQSIKGVKFHNNTECHLGKNIEPENNRYGTGGKKLCDECNRLNLKMPQQFSF